jgi:hypothetical protein
VFPVTRNEIQHRFPKLIIESTRRVHSCGDDLVKLATTTSIPHPHQPLPSSRNPVRVITIYGCARLPTVVSIEPEDAEEYAHGLWAAFSPKLAQIVDVNLPQDTHDRFKRFFDDLGLADLYPIPAWVVSLCAVQNALTAAYYHQRRIAEIENAVIKVLVEVIASMPRLPVKQNSTLRTMTLSYEYQSFLFDFRRSFEYLSLSIAGAFGVTPPCNSRDLAKVLKNVEPHYDAAAKLMRLKVVEVGKRFSRTLAKDSPRNTVAHHRPVEAGDMRVFLDPGLEPRIGLDGGGQNLPMRNVPSEPQARLATVLDQQLTALANAIFELLALIPRSAVGLESHRLP